MAHLDRISPELRIRVAREIGDFIDSGREPEDKSPRANAEAGDNEANLELGETLTVWKLTSQAFETLEKSRLSGDLYQWVEQTPFLYHQIWVRGQVAGFARSYREAESGKKTLLQISASEFAVDLNNLFDMIERNEKQDEVIAGDPVVRLLEIPPFQVFTLWLFSEARNESRIVIINAPEGGKELTPGSVLNSMQFLDGLSESGPLLGVA